jgi:hypothetical protein
MASWTLTSHPVHHLKPTLWKLLTHHSTGPGKSHLQALCKVGVCCQLGGGYRCGFRVGSRDEHPLVNSCESRRRHYLKYHKIYILNQRTNLSVILEWQRMVSHKNYNLNVNEDFVIVLTSKLIMCSINDFTSGMKSQSIAYLLIGSAHIYWILDLEGEVHSI